ncbi:hypothetical protein NDU88_001858 [Pleurodeles waltl]|uniref:Uncharacterized protein n=1 Tax=Pleurodeles waltl TaxID=8319 RepID=A0AAV7W1I6_PLEWA|nr:hypothetical protein NDU88_001858 [Pleurodeles waltl]
MCRLAPGVRDWLVWSSEGEAVGDQAVVRGESTRFDHCTAPDSVVHGIGSIRLKQVPHQVRTMGKDRANKGTQKAQMDQYTAQNAGASLQKDSPGPSEKGAEHTGVQILAGIKSSSWATQNQIAAIAVDFNLLRADLRVAAE